MDLVEKFKTSGTIVGKFSKPQPFSDADLCNEVISLRRLNYLDDNLDPAEVVEEFRSIKRAVDSLCVEISEGFASCRIWSEVPAVAPDSMVTSISAIPHEGIRYALQAMISKQLYLLVFNRFHPWMDDELNDTLSATYQLIRSKEPQRISAKWRSNTFWAYDKLKHDDHGNDKWERKTADVMIGGWHSVLDTTSVPEILREKVSGLLSRACHWNRKARIEVLSFDFHPIANPSLANLPADTVGFPIVSSINPPPYDSSATHHDAHSDPLSDPIIMVGSVPFATMKIVHESKDHKATRLVVGLGLLLSKSLLEDKVQGPTVMEKVHVAIF